MPKFREDNYWGQTRTPSSQAQIQAPPSGTGNIADQKLAALVQDALKRENAAYQAPYGYWSGMPAPGPNNMLGDAKMSINPVQILSTPQIQAGPPTLATQPTRPQPTQDDANKLKSTASSILDMVGSMFGGQQDQQESPEELYARLAKAAGQYTYNGPSADQMAQSEFDPQFQLLDQLKKQTEGRYQSNSKEISGMYQGLVGDQTKDRGTDKAMFDATGKQIQGNYAAAADNVSKGATAYSTAMAQELARLGIKEGAGDVVAGTQSNLQDNLGRLASQGQNSTNLNSQLGANEYAYDTNNIGLTRQAGVNTQQQFMQQMMDALAQNDNQRLGLTGQEQAAKNNYAMQIQDLLQKGQQGLSDSVLNQFKGIQDANQQQSNDYYRQAELDLKQNQFGYQQQQDALKSSGGQGTTSAYDALAQKALGVYGGDPAKSRQAIDEILAAYQNNPNAKTVGDFFNGVDPQELAANPELKSLMFDFISKMIAQQK